MTDAPQPICSACGVPLKEKRTRLTFRLWCPACQREYAYYESGIDAVPQFILDHERRIATMERKWDRWQAETLDKRKESL